MFAFAIGTLVLASCSVLGTGWGKSRFYFLGHDRFLFASEIKALLTDTAVPRQPDPVALDIFLHWLCPGTSYRVLGYKNYLQLIG